MEERKAHLKIENVKKVFQISGQELPVLDGITLDFREGEFVSIVGASGCGNSTLL